MEPQASLNPHLASLLAELGAVLAARRASLEFEREHAALDVRERLGRELHELGQAEAALKDAGPESATLAVAAAVAAADELEQIGRGIFRAMDRHEGSDRAGLVLTVSALTRVARLSETRVRAVATAARQGRRLEGFDEALAFAPETELLLLALRRYTGLLDRDAAWDPRDVDQLFVRALSAPGRLRLEAAHLRFLCSVLAGQAFPAELQEAQEAFVSLNLDLASRLGWAEAGFTPEECVDWRAAGLRKPEQAHAWHCHGFDPVEAAAWAAADFLPDEAGVFVYCGVGELGRAQELRRAVKSVESLLHWKREGFDGVQVLALLAQGIHTPDQARAKGGLPEKGSGTLSEAPELPELSAPEAVAPPPPVPAAPASWIERRAREGFGVEAADPEAALRAQPPQGGAWLGWGVFDAGAAPEGAGGLEAAVSLPLAGGLFDLVADSESLALPGHPGHPAGLEPGEDWEARLSARRRSRGAQPSPGAWHLFGWAPAKALLFWGVVIQSEQAPWAEAVDFDPAETWLHRWARKTEEWGDEGAAAPCRIGRTLSGAWWIGFKEACLEGAAPGEAPRRVEIPWAKGTWRETFEDFCLKMEIPRQAPHWLLAPVAAG